ncbi:uncharacterized protein LOC127443933 [Myxocyprinus asiaticus]|uniref:uncharacterized protein LOC127443933 n=1 Tax=Myxocyprinus asiaticus TaxID=70543 RepID=UPI002221EEF3|nr:uncharacterized protein LOC127443933 [Myxocyprinus asiaticus]
MKFMLIQWIEDPPKWDVLSTNSIINGFCETGSICDVSYKEETKIKTKAKILNIGTRSAMLKQLYSVEKSQSNRNRPREDTELRRGQHQKNRNRTLSESDSSEEIDEPSRDAATEATRNEVGCNEQILAELKEIKSVLVNILELVKNGCTPVITAPVHTLVVTPPVLASDMPAPESTSVVPAPSSGDFKKVRIGPNTIISAEDFAHVKWLDPKKATKDLLMAVFGRRTLATHCYTGKCSNAFKGKPAKPQLVPQNVSDIIRYIKNKFNVEGTLIKKAISQKCADECKRSKRNQN